MLPFADLSPDGDQEYFSDGIAEEILNALVEVDGLVGDAEREVREFRAMRFGDPALRAEQARLVRAMRSIVARMKAVQATLRSGSRAGLPGTATSLLGALEGLPSAAR